MSQGRRTTRSFSKAQVAATTEAWVSTSELRPSKKLKRYEESSTSDSFHNTQSLIAAGDGVAPDTTPKRKGKRKVADAILDRTQFLPRLDIPWKIGAHVSAAGGVENSVVNASIIGANAFALFLKSQRKWTSPPLTDHSIAEFKKNMKEYGYESRHVVPHGSYLINLGNPDAQKREKSYECFLDDLQRCEALGLEMYNFHPGSTVGAARLEESISFIAECINRAHKQTGNVIILLENMAGAGNIIGGDFTHLAKIIAEVENKKRIGVCLDTCHAFAAGYDIRTKVGWDSTMVKFSETIGLPYLRAFHLNDSLCSLDSRKDRHQSIGQGELGLLAFQHIVTDNRTKDIPMVLETPSFEMPKEVWGVEISVLGSLSLSSMQKSDFSVKEAEGSQLGALADQIKVAVKTAEAKNGKSKGRKLTAKSEPSGKKRKWRKGEDDASDVEEDSSCNHD